MNTGAIDSPISLAEALLNRYPIKPGHTVWLRNGTYVGDWVNELQGTVNAPITIRSYPGELAILDGALIQNTSDIIWRDVMITFTGWLKRDTSEAGGSPSDIPTSKGVTINGPRVKFINCIIHDLPNLIGFWTPAVDAELYGNVIYNGGWAGPDRGHGHGIYTQNLTGTKIIRDNIIFNNFDLGYKQYTQSGSAWGYYVEGNVCFNANALYNGPAQPNPWNYYVGQYGTNSVGNTQFVNNYSYSKPGEGRLARNLFGWHDGADALTFEGNVFVEDNAVAFNGATVTNLVATNNQFYGDCDLPANIYPDNIYAAGIPDLIAVRPNAYEPARGHVIIYNGVGRTAVKVDVSAMAVAGQAYQLRNAQDYFNDIQTGTVAQDGTITIDMQAANRTVQAPVAWDAPATTFPLFGAFVLELV